MNGIVVQSKAMLVFSEGTTKASLRMYNVWNIFENLGKQLGMSRGPL